MIEVYTFPGFSQLNLALHYPLKYEEWREKVKGGDIGIMDYGTYQIPTVVSDCEMVLFSFLFV